MAGEIVIITGLQGSGKGTFSSMLAKDHGFVWINMGEILRWHINNKTIIGKRVQNIMQGNMAGDELVNEIIQERLRIHDWDHPLVLDGYPRSIGQADFLTRNVKVKAVVNLRITDDLAIERIRHRSLISGSGARADDVDDCAIKRRIKLYYQETAPMLTIFERMGVLHHVVNTGSIESTYNQIKGALGIS